MTEILDFQFVAEPFAGVGAGVAALLRRQLVACGFDLAAEPGYRVAGAMQVGPEGWRAELEIAGGALPQVVRRSEHAAGDQPHHLLCRVFEFLALTLGVSAPTRVVRGFDDWRTAVPAALLAALAGEPQRAFELDPALPAARVELARRALAAGRAPAAAALLEGVVVSDPATASELGLALWIAALVMPALGLLQQAVQGDPDDAMAAAALAALLARHGGPEAADEAIYLATRASELAPNDYRTWAALADGYRQRGEWRQAGFFYGMALRLEPAKGDLLKDATANWLLAGDAEQARALSERGLALDPGDADHHGNLALAHRAAGRSELAAAAIRRALELRPEDERLQALATELRAAIG